jgi:hypothetical protein
MRIVANQNSCSLLGNRKVHYRIHYSSLLVPIQSQKNSDHTFISPAYACSILSVRVTFYIASHRCGPGFETGPGHVGFVVGQSGVGAGFLRVLRFPLQSSFAPPITPQSPSYTIRGMHNRPLCGSSAGTYRDLGDLNKETQGTWT